MIGSFLTAVIGMTVLGQGGDAGARVAVVNIPQVSERYQRRVDLEGQFETKRRELAQRRDALRSEVERIQRSLQEELRPGTDAYRQRERELAMKRAELDYFLESEGKQIEAELAASLQMIFQDALVAVRQVAQERGIDVVLAAEQMPPGDAENPAQVRQQIVLQKVLYWEPSIDLTDAVVERLNTNYQQQKK